MPILMSRILSFNRLHLRCMFPRMTHRSAQPVQNPLLTETEREEDHLDAGRLSGLSSFFTACKVLRDCGCERAEHNAASTDHTMSAGGAFGGSRGLQPRAPEKGVFPLDHFGECKQVCCLVLLCTHTAGRAALALSVCSHAGITRLFSLPKRQYWRCIKVQRSL